MKYLRGFLMAWGNFSAIPCPYQGWHDDCRKAMLCMLPLIGTLLGAICVAAWALLDWLGLPALLSGVFLMALYFCCSGFIHLDGFMDCSDAILSRRPALSQRQRILKDSAVGAFAVIAVGLMFMVFAASMVTLSEEFSFRRAGMLVIIMTVSRGLAADCIARKPVMQSSQYADLADSEAGLVSLAEKARLAERNFRPLEGLVLTAMTIWPILVIPAVTGYGNAPFRYVAYYIMVVLTMLIGESAAGAYARRQLGGMSGDVAGYMIVSGELFGMMAAAMAASYLGI